MQADSELQVTCRHGMHAMSDLKRVQMHSSTMLIKGSAYTSILHSNPHTMSLSFLAFGRHHANAESPSLVCNLYWARLAGGM